MAGAFDDFDPAGPPKKGAFADFDAGPATPNQASPAPSPPAQGGVLPAIAGGVHKAAQFINTAVDSGTFGLSDWLAGHLSTLAGGPGVDAMRTTTQQGRDDLGTVPSVAADVAGYALGPGKFGAGSKVADMLGGLWKARVAGGAAEGAGAAALGTAGHGDTDLGHIGTAMLLGGGVGAITGGLPGQRAAPQGIPTSAMESDAASAWQGPNQMPVSAEDAADALQAAYGGMDPGKRFLMSDVLDSKVGQGVKDISDLKGLGMTAGQLSDFQRGIGNAARGSDDKRLAIGFKDALESAYDPASLQAVKAARAATNKAKISASIDDWRSDPATAPDKINAAITKNPQYYQSRPGLLEQMQAIANMGQPSMAKDLANDAGKRLVRGALAGALGGPTAGVVTAAIGAPARTAIDAAPVRRALLAAQHLNNTGDVVAASAFAPQHPRLKMISDLLRQAGYSAGASGAF